MQTLDRWTCIAIPTMRNPNVVGLFVAIIVDNVEQNVGFIFGFSTHLQLSNDCTIAKKRWAEASFEKKKKNKTLFLVESVGVNALNVLIINVVSTSKKPFFLLKIFKPAVDIARQLGFILAILKIYILPRCEFEKPQNRSSLHFRNMFCSFLLTQTHWTVELGCFPEVKNKKVRW